MDWDGRQLLDANGGTIGVIAGAAYDRRRFGTAWLVVSTVSGRRFPVPADHIREAGDDLVLPYPLGYVETGPTLEGDGPLDAAGERRLRLHYGIGLGSVSGHCQGCGLCMASTRAAKRRQRAG